MRIAQLHAPAAAARKARCTTQVLLLLSSASRHEVWPLFWRCFQLAAVGSENKVTV